MLPKLAYCLCALLLLSLATLYARYRYKRKGIDSLLEPEALPLIANDLAQIHQINDWLTQRRKGDFFDRWGEDLASRSRTSGAAVAVASGFWDLLTLGGSARRRARAKELEAATFIAEMTERIFGTASDNIRRCVSLTGRRLQLGLELLRVAQRITDPLLAVSAFPITDERTAELRAIGEKCIRLQAGSAQFLDIATAAGAGATTALGLWGVVQVAGYASTGTAMSGLYGAAAHNAGWAWFGGGSLASGGGGMALGHLVLPGVGAAVSWTVLVTRLHRAANQAERQIRETEQWNLENLPIVSRMCEVEAEYRHSAAKLREALQHLDHAVSSADIRLRRFGLFSDWIRKARVARGKTYYSAEEMNIVEQLGDSVDSFLGNLPVSAIHGHAN